MAEDLVPIAHMETMEWNGLRMSYFEAVGPDTCDVLWSFVPINFNYIQ